MNFFGLPSEIRSKIYQMDPTYRIVLQTEVHKELIHSSWTVFFTRFLENNVFEDEIRNQLQLIFLFIISENVYGTSHHDNMQLTSNWRDIIYADSSLTYIDLPTERLKFYTDIRFGIGSLYDRLETFVYMHLPDKCIYHDVFLSKDFDYEIVRIPS